MILWERSAEIQNPFRWGSRLRSLKPILKQVSLSRSLFFSVCAYAPETIDLDSIAKIEIETGCHTSRDFHSQSLEVLSLLLFVCLPVDTGSPVAQVGLKLSYSQWWSWTPDPSTSACQVLEAQASANMFSFQEFALGKLRQILWSMFVRPLANLHLKILLLSWAYMNKFPRPSPFRSWVPGSWTYLLVMLAQVADRPPAPVPALGMHYFSQNVYRLPLAKIIF